jgi:hypothetical protein
VPVSQEVKEAVAAERADIIAHHATNDAPNVTPAIITRRLQDRGIEVSLKEVIAAMQQNAR